MTQNDIYDITPYLPNKTIILDILNGNFNPDSLTKPGMNQLVSRWEVGISHLLSLALSDRIKEIQTSVGSDFKNSPDFAVWLNQSNNTLQFVINSFRFGEPMIMFMRGLTDVYQLPLVISDLPAFARFADKFQ